jgi:thiamine biosynthesis protein ThiS
MQIHIILNGQASQIDADLTIHKLLSNLGYNSSSLAVAINTNFIAHNHYASTVIQEKDCIEIVMPMQGG